MLSSEVRAFWFSFNFLVSAEWVLPLKWEENRLSGYVHLLNPERGDFNQWTAIFTPKSSNTLQKNPESFLLA